MSSSCRGGIPHRRHGRAARGTYTALGNADVYRVVTEERGWDADQVEQWWLQSLGLLLLADGD